MPALVLEGGTFRPIFSCGVMDAMLDHKVYFPYMIGVSAGVTDGASYVSRQPKRNYDVLMAYRHDKRYIGMRNYLTDRSMFGIKFVFEEIPCKLNLFDWDAYYNSDTVIRVGVTNAATGKAEYLDGKQLDRQCTMLKATCALPLVFPAIKLNGQEYFDGGLCDSIPVKKAEEDGHTKMLVILTQPQGYRKQLTRANVTAARLLKRKYPNMVEPLLTRHQMYNAQLDYCAQLEQEGRAVVLRPDQSVRIDSFEKDMDKIKALYEYGYRLAEENMQRIEDLFEK